MQHYRIRKISDTDSKCEVYARGLFRYHKVTEQVFDTVEEAYAYIHEQTNGVTVIIREV